jgi:phage-related holin
MKDVLIKYAQPLLLSALAVIAPIKATLITVGIVIGVDFITGILAARKRGETLKSAPARRTISKVLIYHTAILTGFLIETYLMKGAIPITSLVSGLIGSVEALSIYENLNTISGKNVFGSLIKILGSANDDLKDKPK